MAGKQGNGKHTATRRRPTATGAVGLVAAEVAPPAQTEVDKGPASVSEMFAGEQVGAKGDVIRVRRMHRRDIKRVWEFLKRVFRDVNQKTVELQRARSRRRFEEIYDNEGIDQLVFDIDGQIVGYAESTFEVSGADNWINWRWFEARDMRPLFVEELAVDPAFQGRGVGGFMLEQLRHIASLRGCTHLVLEVAENNVDALHFYRKRNFYKIDAAIFLAQKIERLPELLPPRPLAPAKPLKSTPRQKAAAGVRKGSADDAPPAPRTPPRVKKATSAATTKPATKATKSPAANRTRKTDTATEAEATPPKSRRSRASTAP